MFEIEKNVEIWPQTYGLEKSDLRKTLEEMETGDSIVVPSDLVIRRKVNGIAREINIKVSVRKLDEKNHRVWRVK